MFNSYEKFQVIQGAMQHDKIANAAVFNVLRTLKRVNPGDTYYEAYLGHYSKRGDSFVDYYHLLWAIGAMFSLSNVMEIGCRTGISICQLLSAQKHPANINVHLFDIFNDGFISESLVKMNLRTMNLPTANINFHVGNSRETVPAFAETNPVPMDYILVDGDHSREGAMADLDNVVPLLGSGGILFFDDIAPDGCNLLDVWQWFEDKYKDMFYFAYDLNGKGIGIGVKK